MRRKNVNNRQCQNLLQCCILISSSNEITSLLNVTAILIKFNEEVTLALQFSDLTAY